MLRSRPPTYHQLKLQLWWIPREGQDTGVEIYRSFFQEQTLLVDIDATFSMSDVRTKPVKKLHEENIFQVDVTIEWPRVSWLGAPAKYLQHATHPFDRDIRLSSVAFGTLVQLGTFVPHHLFSSSIVHDHRNYWVDATFLHDQRMLNIDLHLNHRSACEGHLTEYRFIVPYLNIRKVLINEKIRGVELYLQLRIPAMLMGEPVNDIPPRAGRAAAAAPIRWERHLAVGCPCIGGPVRTASLCGALYLKLVFRDPFIARRVIGRLSQRCAQGTLFCYAPIRTYCPDAAAAHRTEEVMVHFENRILRQFNGEFAIRASFRDDNLDKLSFTLNLHSSRDAMLDTVVGRYLREGLRIGSREFKFLAPSTSQLRDHGYEAV
ncbi:hypothetical protein HPB50_010158 [Hyalomma asiaticum]|uniref:Uncharacterized protein n=1 Tax=Hyalomma asiaticum TaxID=266040 RepID=A0ACB7T420_HYAAI|nr:hypothetical protein HPB50_010158 [Hyalomma asiaticum]